MRNFPYAASGSAVGLHEKHRVLDVLDGALVLVGGNGQRSLDTLRKRGGEGGAAQELQERAATECRYGSHSLLVGGEQRRPG